MTLPFYTKNIVLVINILYVDVYIIAKRMVSVEKWGELWYNYKKLEGDTVDV